MNEHASGALPSSVPTTDPDVLAKLFRDMVRARALDGACVSLQRQGVFAAIAPFIGHEAVQIGAMYALDRTTDFVFPTYRELAAAYAWGVDIVAYLAQARGFSHGGSFNHAEARFGPIAAEVAGSVLHAVGWAMGQRLDRRKGVALVFFGDGASSQGDVHEALNCAGIFHAPVVFLCVNNGWAISVPASAQVAGGSVAARAAGYGLRGVTVDGGDVLAVWAAVRDAAASARTGEPVLIEARTYRYGPHSTSDNPDRYRTQIADEKWSAEDPVARYAAWLRGRGLLDQDGQGAAEREAQAWAAGVADKVKALTPPGIEDMFRFAYRAPPASVLGQQRAIIEEAGRD
ncbi:MAG TPA: thiamine pyrophosphate-dependent enzyme [Rhodanobacteraceae bacterium]